MKLSTRGKYGLYAMYYLAAHAGEGRSATEHFHHGRRAQAIFEQLWATFGVRGW